MSNNKGIWSFVEEKLNCKVPDYIKNVLEVCGYTNGITIATIEEDDIKYFEDEVKNGNVSKHFGDVKNALEGSNKTKDNFEFLRGHVKLLMKIKDFLKGHMDLNGPESFTMEANASNKSKVPEVVDKENDKRNGIKRKNASKECIVKSKVTAIRPENISEEDMKKHREVIYTKMTKSLIKLTPEMLSAAKERITPDYVKTEVIAKKQSKTNEEGPSGQVETIFKLVGDVRCPYCSIKTIRVHHEPTEKNAFLWKTTNWGRHLRLFHNGNKNSNNSGKTENGDSEDNDIFTLSSTSNERNSVVSSPKKAESLNIDSHKNNNKNIPAVYSTAKDEIIEIMDDAGHQSEDNTTVKLISKSNENSSIPSGSKKHESLNMKYPLTAKLVSYSDSSDCSDVEDYSANDRCGKNERPSGVDVENEIKYFSEGKSTDVLGADGNNIVASIPVFRNGHSSTNKSCKQTIVTRNTCSFDSIFSIYECLYFDEADFRETFTPSNEKSRFALLIKTYFSTFSSKTQADSSELSKLYDDRNIILKEVFTKSTYHLNNNVKKNGDMLYIDCNTGIGRLFGQLCMGVCPFIASAIEIKTCQSCKKESRTVLPFIPVAPIALDLANIQKSICPAKPKARCRYCQGKCIAVISYNNVLVLEVEPNTTVKYQKKSSIRNMSQTIVVEKEFHLCGVIEFDPTIRHFKSHIKRKNKQWMTYDDIQIAEIKIQESEEILPYLMFYVNGDFDKDFLTACLVSTSKNAARGIQSKNHRLYLRNLRSSF